MKTFDDVVDEFDEYLDEYNEVVIAGYTIECASCIIRRYDPNAYWTEFDKYIQDRYSIMNYQGDVYYIPLAGE